jgi:hypothetical protein
MPFFSVWQKLFSMGWNVGRVEGGGLSFKVSGDDYPLLLCFAPVRRLKNVRNFS